MTQRTTIEELRAWMRRVMDQRRWSAEQWARQAGTSPTNITRFLNNDEPRFVPSGATLAKLAVTCGENPNFLAQTQDAGILIPIADRHEIKSTGEIVSRGTLPVSAEFSDCVAIEIETDALVLEGIPEGSTCLVRQRQPKHGDRVLFLDGSKRITGGLLQPPFLMPQSITRTQAPIRVDDVRVLGVIEGVVVRFMRERDQPSPAAP